MRSSLPLHRRVSTPNFSMSTQAPTTLTPPCRPLNLARESPQHFPSILVLHPTKISVFLLGATKTPCKNCSFELHPLFAIRSIVHCFSVDGALTTTRSSKGRLNRSGRTLTRWLLLDWMLVVPRWGRTWVERLCWGQMAICSKRPADPLSILGFLLPLSVTSRTSLIRDSSLLRVLLPGCLHHLRLPFLSTRHSQYLRFSSPRTRRPQYLPLSLPRTSRPLRLRLSSLRTRRPQYLRLSFPRTRRQPGLCLPLLLAPLRLPLLRPLLRPLLLRPLPLL